MSLVGYLTIQSSEIFVPVEAEARSMAHKALPRRDATCAEMIQSEDGRRSD